MRGKSAQIPLYVWLPDAMAGPTPVSALIHAATMVTAGVYLIARSNVLFALAPVAQIVVVVIGALTAIFAASIGLKQWDIKKVLAYSTVSQLGYMFIGVGSGAYVAGVFHLVTHAFFKALLFLGSGSVIFAMHRAYHHTGNHDDAQDMRNMGGLRQYMPTTFALMWIATLAIAAFRRSLDSSRRTRSSAPCSSARSIRRLRARICSACREQRGSTSRGFLDWRRRS
jgi:NADH-quinone oxidoreductase subunit L